MSFTLEKAWKNAYNVFCTKIQFTISQNLQFTFLSYSHYRWPLICSSRKNNNPVLWKMLDNVFWFWTTESYQPYFELPIKLVYLDNLFRWNANAPKLKSKMKPKLKPNLKAIMKLNLKLKFDCWNVWFSSRENSNEYECVLLSSFFAVSIVRRWTFAFRRSSSSDLYISSVKLWEIFGELFFFVSSLHDPHQLHVIQLPAFHR
jgi:hypothetical protein